MAENTSPSRGRRGMEEFRAQPQGFEIRDDEDGKATLTGYLARFDEWTEINSRAEGNFLERIAPGAFTKTIAENLQRMRVLFQHGKDPAIGDKPLGPIRALDTDDEGVRYEVELLDTSYNRDIAEMLKADPPVLGSSFRFEVLREDRKRRPGKSEHNPRGLDERTVEEVRMSEFGPVTFPAYAGSTAGLRSLTDRYGEERMDVEDLSILAQMLELGTAYVAEQDEADDAPNIPKMEAVLASIADLVPVEVAENEPPDDEMLSEEPGGAEGAVEVDAPPDDRAALDAHPIRMGRRDPDPLYTGKRETPSWQL